MKEIDKEFGQIIELHTEDFFAPGEQVFIHIDESNSDYSGVMHRHDFIEIVYVIKGRARHYIGNQNYEVKKDDLAIVNYGVPHTFIGIDGDDEFSTYDLLFTPELFGITGIGKSDFSSLASSYLFYSLFDDNNKVGGNLNLIRHHDAEIRRIFEKIYKEFTEKNKGHMTIIRAYLIELITRIFREIDYRVNTECTSEQKTIVNKAITYMKKNYNTHIDIEKIAADIFLNKDYFRQLFKKTTGMSVTDFFQNTRIEEAKKLLRTTERSIYDIAGECGFADLTFFYKVFKKKTGETPGEFRKNASAKNKK